MVQMVKMDNKDKVNKDQVHQDKDKDKDNKDQDNKHLVQRPQDHLINSPLEDLDQDLLVSYILFLSIYIKYKHIK